MTERAVKLTRFSFVAAPVLLAVYGSIRLLAPASKEPGPAWIIGHIAFLGGALLLALVCEGLRRAAVDSAGAARRRVVRTAWAAALAGVAAASAQAVIDIYVGFRAADKPEMSEMFDRVQSLPGVLPVVYTVVPLFLHLGMIGLLAALKGPGAARSLVLFVLGTLAITVDLDLLPIGGLCYLLAFIPLRHRVATPRATFPRRPAPAGDDAVGARA